MSSKLEVETGWADCLSALKFGAWEDAAKLISIYGAEQGVYVAVWWLRQFTPLRYSLEFFECGACREHVARLTQDELVKEKWVPGPRYIDVFKGASGRRAPALTRILAAARSSVFVSTYIVKGMDYTALRVPVLTLSAFSLIFVMIFLALNPGLVYRIFTQNRGARAMAKLTPSPDCLKLRFSAEALYEGNLRPRDVHQAVLKYTEAAKCGDAESANRLGEVYERGDGIPRDSPGAFVWYQNAAESGYGPAEFNLARMYEDGTAVPRNVTEAIRWYDRASEAGVLGAKVRADHLRSGLK